MLDEIGLETAIRCRLDGLINRGGTRTALELEPAAFPRLPHQHEKALYQIVLEA